MSKSGACSARMKQPDRAERFHVLLSKQERQWLDTLANRDGVKAADIVRKLVRDAHKAIEKIR